METIIILLPIIGIILKALGLSFEKITKAYLYFSLFCVIFVASSTFFPFIGGKDFFFRVAIEMALAAAFLWWAFEAKAKELSNRFKKILHQPLFMTVSFFALAVLLSAIFAYDPNAAFWSNFERGEGGFQFLHYYVFFTLLVFFFNRKEDWDLGAKTSLLAAVLMILYGVAALLKINNFIGPGICERFQGSLGNPAYVAPYLMFAMFYVLYSWFQGPKKETHNKGLLWSGLISVLLFSFLVVTNISFQAQNSSSQPVPLYASIPLYGSFIANNPSATLYLTVIAYLIFPLIYGIYLFKKNASGKDILREITYASLFASFFFFFLLTQTRGAFLGIGAAIIAGLFYSLFLPFKKRVKKIIIIVAILALAVGGLAYANRQHNIPLVPFCDSSSRLVDISFGESTAQTRLWTWGSAIQGWKERPLFGWGQENFSVVFDKFFNEHHFVPNQGTETWFDRAHSVIFDYLTETGIIGLLAYLSVLLVFVLQLIWPHKEKTDNENRNQDKSNKDSKSEFPPILKASFLAIIVGYFVQALVLFDVLPIYMNLFFVLALGSYYFSLKLTTHHERHS